jgi:hypothetical protein
MGTAPAAGSPARRQATRRPLNAQGRKVQADALRRFLPAAEGYTQAQADEAAEQVLRGDVEYDPDWLESAAPKRGKR